MGIRIDKISLFGNITYSAYDTKTGDVLITKSFSQRQIQAEHGAIFNELASCICCPDCGVVMTCATEFK